MKELPDNASVVMRWAVAVFNVNLYRLCALLCRLHLLTHSDEYFGLCWLANSLYHMGHRNDRKAERLFLKAIEVDSSSALAHFGLGRVHHGNAIKLSERYSFAPGSQEIVFHNEVSAEEYLSQSGPRSFSMGDHGVGNRNVAIYELRKAAEMTDDVDERVAFLYMIAEVQCTKSNEEAINTYQRILSLTPDDLDAHFHIAGCHAALGNVEQARQEFDIIKKQAPDMVQDLKDTLAHFGICVD